MCRLFFTYNRLVIGAAGRMMTRGFFEKQKTRRNVIMAKTEDIIGSLKEKDFKCESSELVFSYMQVSDYYKRFGEVVKVLQDHESTKLEDEVSLVENFGKLCITTCEEIYGKLPTTHALKTRQPPLHLEISLSTIFPQGSVHACSASQSKVSCLNEPKLERFDGKASSSWILWKCKFEREVHKNSDLSSDRKFDYLLEALVKDSPPYRSASVYAGINGCYDLAWKDLNDVYGLGDNVQTHLRSLRDLPKTHRIQSPHNLDQRIALYQEILLHANVLKALQTPEETYETSSFLGIMDSLPAQLRSKYLTDYDMSDEEDDPHGSLKKIMNFLQREIKLLRKTREFAQEASSFSNQRKVGRFDQRHERKRDVKKYKNKRSLMMLEDKDKEANSLN